MVASHLCPVHLLSSTTHTVSSMGTGFTAAEVTAVVPVVTEVPGRVQAS